MAEQSGQRIAILSIGVFLLVGLILLTFVDEKKARRAANKPTAATPSSPLETS
jgi:MFS-type transporter involved in bile tolerance (Atg22 family)